MSLDDSLVHYFGRIKLKFIIVKKSYWYEMKIYVVTDV